MTDKDTTIFEVDEDQYTQFESILNTDSSQFHLPDDSIFGTYFELDNDV